MYGGLDFRYQKENSMSDDAGLVNKKTVFVDRHVPNHTLIFSELQEKAVSLTVMI